MTDQDRNWMGILRLRNDRQKFAIEVGHPTSPIVLAIQRAGLITHIDRGPLYHLMSEGIPPVNFDIYILTTAGVIWLERKEAEERAI